MAKLPRITAIDLIRVMRKLGFKLDRQKGSHQVHLDPAGRRVVVPVHAGKILLPKVLKDALRNAAVSVEEFVRLLRDA